MYIYVNNKQLINVEETASLKIYRKSQGEWCIAAVLNSGKAIDVKYYKAEFFAVAALDLIVEAIQNGVIIFDLDTLSAVKIEETKNSFQKYEQLKQFLLTLNLNDEQYETIVKAVADALGI